MGIGRVFCISEVSAATYPTEVETIVVWETLDEERYPFRIHGIVWDDPAANLPQEATVWLSNHLVESGPEDCEPEGFDGDLDDLDDDAVEAFWDSYQASDEARDAWEAEWATAIKVRLEADHGGQVASFGLYRPIEAEE